MSDLRTLSRRERQIMDFLYQRGRATAAEVQAGIDDAPGYSAVRALLRTLEEKGVATHSEEGRAYVYRPTVSRDQARSSALSHLVATFFGGSREQAVAALLEPDGAGLSPEALERMARLVDAARAEGR